MDFTETIKLLWVKRKISMKELARISNQSGQNLYNKLTRNDWKQSELRRVFDALNVSAKVEIIDNETGKPFTFQ